MGRLLASLAALHVRDNTLLLLSSDNGPEHREANSWGSAAGLRGAKVDVEQAVRFAAAHGLDIHGG